MKHPKHRHLPLLAAAALALGACDDSPSGIDGDGRARLVVQLTDAPIDLLASAEVVIGRVEILPADGAPVTVVENAGTFDLLQLQNGVTTTLGDIELEAGRYTQLRLIVQSARVTLREGLAFQDGSTTQDIKVPSGAQTGIKIQLSGADGEDDAGIEITGQTTLVVDFDVSQNFVVQGNPDTPAGIRGFLFTPSLRAAVRDVSGSIAGTVAAPQGVAVEGLTVQATRTDVSGQPPATTLVAADGTFKIHFLPPGAYDVTVGNPPTGHVSNTVQVTVGEDQDVTGVGLQLTAS